jgi:hypothetical protein
MLSNMRRAFLLAVGLTIGFNGQGAATTVDGQANIYIAGIASPPALSGGTGFAPVAIAVTPGQVISFSSITGLVNCCGVAVDTLPDGGSSYATSLSALHGISGIAAPVQMFLAGVFGTATNPLGAAPPALNFTAGGLGTDFSGLSPALWQSFFIGDGRRLDGTTLQTFTAPALATVLYLGFADGLGFSGSPGYYADNRGSFEVTLAQSAVPLPGALPLFATGLGIAGLVGWRRKRRGADTAG